MSQPSNNLNLNNKEPHEEEDDDLVILPDVDNSELIARYQLSLVGRLFKKERRSVEALIALLPRPSIWDVEGRARGVDLGNYRFQFDFDSEADLHKVLSKRPCHFNKWSFALERWTPHIGHSFPNKMTFWVSVTGIPTHFWLDPIFRALGKRLGLVGNVEAKAAKFELELYAELPLKVNLRAQLPSGEIVPVSLEYSNLHRWCHNCRLLSHEVETCPQLNEANRNGENSRRSRAPDSKAPVLQERRPGDYSQRDNRDSVWKRIDSRNASRENPRRDHHHAPRELEKQPHQKETYNKRRYEESFASSRQRVEERKATSKILPSKKISEEEHLPSASRAKQPALPTAPLEPVTEEPQRESIRTSSPEHVRERPFKLNLQKRSSANQKLKGKESDLEIASDMEQEEALIVSAKVSKQLAIDGLSALEESNKFSEKTSPHARSDHRSDSRSTQTPSSSSRPSPAKKKRGSPSPIATGVSLRQRNLVVGRTSSKQKVSKNRPKLHKGLSTAYTQVPSDIEKAEMFPKNIKKSAKVGSNKPPKIPG
ncbi:hypothetical protein YC2023_089408 [Brassica napus]